MTSNGALQRTGAMHVSFMSHWFYNIINFGGRPLLARVAELSELDLCDAGDRLSPQSF